MEFPWFVFIDETEVYREYDFECRHIALKSGGEWCLDSAYSVMRRFKIAESPMVGSYREHLLLYECDARFILVAFLTGHPEEQIADGLLFQRWMSAGDFVSPHRPELFQEECGPNPLATEISQRDAAALGWPFGGNNLTWSVSAELKQLRLASPTAVATLTKPPRSKRGRRPDPEIQRKHKDVCRRFDEILESSPDLGRMAIYRLISDATDFEAENIRKIVTNRRNKKPR